MVKKSANSVRQDIGSYGGKELWKKVSFQPKVEEKRHKLYTL